MHDSETVANVKLAGLFLFGCFLININHAIFVCRNFSYVIVDATETLHDFIFLENTLTKMFAITMTDFFSKTKLKIQS